MVDRRKACWILLSALLVIVLAGCHSGHEVADDETAATPYTRDNGLIVVPEKSPLRRYLQIADAERRTLQTPLEAPAVIEADPSRVANILPPLSGRISALYVHLGDVVKTGQALFKIDSADLAQARSDLQHARIGLIQTQKALARTRDLYDHHIAAQKDVEQGQADYDNAQSEFERASAVFKVLGLPTDSVDSPRELTVKSPVAGSVTALNAVAGTFANDNTAALMTVADLSTVWFTAAMQEKDLSFVKVGEDITAAVQSFADESFNGKVRFVAGQLDPDTRTIKVRIDYDNRDARLKPGMFAKVTFAGTPHEAVTVPATALVQVESRTIVFVETSPWKFEPRTVIVGATAGDHCEILSGLKGGEHIVVKQGVLLND